MLTCNTLSLDIAREKNSPLRRIEVYGPEEKPVYINALNTLDRGKVNFDL